MSLRINLLFSASPQQLFDAWTRNAIVKQWLLNQSTNIMCADINPRPGGKLLIWENDRGRVFSYFGEYMQVIWPTRLNFTFNEPAQFQEESRVSVQFKATEVGTEMHFVQVGVDARVVEGSWQQRFQKLTILLLDGHVA